MNAANQDRDIRKNALKELRKFRKQEIAEVSRRVKEQRKNIQAIMESFEEQAGTVPEIARATGFSPANVLWYLATLKKYGQVTETEKTDSYYRYQTVEGKGDASTS